DGVGVVWTVDQTFVNTLAEAIEAVYTFPLPNGGAVTSLTLRIGDRTVVADIKERGQARVEYEEALAKGQTAALMEQHRGEIFEIAVGNIHPGESITVEITVHDTVDRDGNEATVRIPTYVKERFVPAGTPDAGAVTPPRHDGDVHVQSRINISFAAPVEDAVCDTVEAAVITDSSVVIEDFSLDRDVVVRWQVPAETMDAKWTADSDDPSMGTVEVVIRTVNAPLTGMRRRRAVSILLDRSGSMSGWNMDAARRIVEDILGTVSDEDLVHVLAFDNGMEALAPCEHGFVRATARAKSALRRALKKIDARGGTNLTGAITAAGAVLGTLEDMDDSADIERVAVLITDGAYGDEAEAVRQRDLELGGARVIVVGIGQDMNGYLETLSANGLFAYLPSPERTGDVSRKVCERIAQPAHRNARLAMDGLADQAPHLAPDIYPGATVTLWGRAPRPTADTTVTVVTDSGILAAVPVRVCADSSATSRWAKEHINSIDYDVMSGRVQEAAGRARIIEVSMRRRVLSKYTAWLAIDTSRTTDTIIPKRIVQPTYSMDALLSSESLGVVYCRTTVRPSMLAADMAWSFAPSMPSMPSIRWRGPSDASAALLEGLIDELNDLVDADDDEIDTDEVIDCVGRILGLLVRRGRHGLDRATRDKIRRRATRLTSAQVLPAGEIVRIAREIVSLHGTATLGTWEELFGEV
ncbi:MAG: hypothetical protein RLZZ93_904, partial [Actinomycetota bacterium]